MTRTWEITCNLVSVNVYRCAIVRYKLDTLVIIQFLLCIVGNFKFCTTRRFTGHFCSIFSCAVKLLLRGYRLDTGETPQNKPNAVCITFSLHKLVRQLSNTVFFAPLNNVVYIIKRLGLCGYMTSRQSIYSLSCCSQLLLYTWQQHYMSISTQ